MRMYAVVAKDGRITEVAAEHMVVYGKEGYVEFWVGGDPIGVATLANIELVFEALVVERLAAAKQ